MTETSPFPKAEQLYEKRSKEFATQAAYHGRHEGKLTFGRAITFLVGAGCFVMAAFDPNLRVVWLVAGGLLVGAFLTLAIYQEWLQRQRHRCLNLQRVNQRQLNRCLRNWGKLPEVEINVPDQHRPVAHDLDLFGRCSLFKLVSLAFTPRGVTMLRDWLLQPATPSGVLERQAAVRQLAGEWQLREELALRGELLTESVAGPEAFERWAESSPLLQQHPVQKWLSRVLPIVTLLSIVALVGRLVTTEVGGFALLISLILNVVFSVLFDGKVQDVFDNISTRCGELRHYIAMFDLLQEVPDGPVRLAAIRDCAVREQHGAVYQLRRLNGVMFLASIRHASLMSILYFGLQALVLWDFHVLFLLERWQRRCGRQVRRWFDALAEFETLASLSSLAFDNPDWVFPTVDSEGLDAIVGVNLAHPLLRSDVRVANDVQIGPKGSVLLVTGSNMSGKSTLLRAIGLNVVLAEAGGPVCAESLSMPPLIVATSMRIQDSLEDGVSFYMAELRRLKAVVDLASAYQTDNDWQLLYLLDEILQGTNSVERHIAVGRVLSHLVNEGAIGAVSTHDLALAGSGDLSGVCRPVHFRETLHGQDLERQMTFDYRLRPGVATTTNALKLLELVGLG